VGPHPILAPGVVAALCFLREAFAARDLREKLLVLRAVGDGRIDQHAMRLALDRGEVATDESAIDVVAIENRSVGRQLQDHDLAAQGGE